MFSRDCIHCQKNTLSQKIIKCCDYFPFIPNFLVGKGLKKDRKKWMAAIDSEGVIWQPLGLLASLDFKRVLKDQRLKQKTAYHCFFYSPTGGCCEIWGYRPAYCKSYFCEIPNTYKSQFHQSLNKYVEEEMKWAQTLLIEMGFILKEIRNCIRDYNEGVLSKEVQSLILKDEMSDYYIKCYELFQKMKLNKREIKKA